MIQILNDPDKKAFSRHCRKIRKCLLWAFSPFPHVSHPIKDKKCHSQPFPKWLILDSSKLKEFADENSVFDEDGRKFPKQVENTVGKGEIARHEQFLLFRQCFQKTYSTDT